MLQLQVIDGLSDCTFKYNINKSRLKSSFTQTQGTAHVLSLPDAVIDNAIQNQQLTPIKLRSKQ